MKNFLNCQRENYVYLLIIILSLLFSCKASQAATIIRADRAKIRHSILPGSSKAGVINIENPTDTKKHIKAYLEDWSYTNQEGSKDFKPAGSTDLSCANWISFAPTEFSIPAFAKQAINYTVRVPQDARGGHYAILFLEASPGEVTEDKGVAVGLAIRVGSLFYIEAEGTIRRQANLENFVLERETRGGPLKVRLDFTNTGNVDINAGGLFHIMDRKGMVVARSAFNEVYTLPGDSAKLIATWKEPIPKGKYDLVITLDLGKALEELNLGRGPVITKEAEIEIGLNTEVIKIGELR